jgi:hypothetical protein
MTALRPSEQAMIESLDAAIRAPRSAAILAAMADEVSAELAGKSNARLAWRPIPLEVWAGVTSRQRLSCRDKMNGSPYNLGADIQE